MEIKEHIQPGKERTEHNPMVDSQSKDKIMAGRAHEYEKNIFKINKAQLKSEHILTFIANDNPTWWQTYKQHEEDTTVTKD